MSIDGYSTPLLFVLEKNNLIAHSFSKINQVLTVNEHILHRSNVDLDDSLLLQHRCQTYIQIFSACVYKTADKFQNLLMSIHICSLQMLFMFWFTHLTIAYLYHLECIIEGIVYCLSATCIEDNLYLMVKATHCCFDAWQITCEVVNTFGRLLLNMF